MSSSDASGNDAVDAVDAALPVCIPGLQGLPIQVSGWSSFTDRDSITIPNDITCQFSQGPGSFQNLQQNTFFMNGTQYFVSAYDITKPKQEGLLDRSSTNQIGELHIWGKPTATTLEQTSIALFSIPLFEGAELSEIGKNFTKIGMGLSDVIPSGKNIQVIKYTTCLETQASTLIVHVAYWTVGITITSDVRKTVFGDMSQFKTFGIPVSLLNSDKVLSSYTQYNDENRSKTKRIYKMSKTNNYSIPYFITVVLNTTSPEFTNRFRIIKGFSITNTGGSATKLDTSSYKCVAINRQRDIKDGKLLIDPRTGKTLAEETANAEKQEQDSINPNPNPTNSPYMVLLIILGIILGICGIALVVYFIQYLISLHGAPGAAGNAGNAGNGVNAVAAANTGVAGNAGAVGAVGVGAATAAVAANAVAAVNAAAVANAVAAVATQPAAQAAQAAQSIASAAHAATASASTASTASAKP